MTPDSFSLSNFQSTSSMLILENFPENTGRLSVSGISRLMIFSSHPYTSSNKDKFAMLPVCIKVVKIRH